MHEKNVIEKPIPRVFISYSWTNEDHVNWVLELANQLMDDGVEVTMDQWDLKEGQDVYHFMETMVRSTEIDKVLIICDNEYRVKAESKKGGVGTEAQIISPEVYGNVNQEKFIPIIAERDDEGRPCLPTFIKTRIYIDLSSSEKYVQEYEKLLRNLYKRPARRKPARGEAPDYLFNDMPVLLTTSKVNKRINDFIKKSGTITQGTMYEFIDEFVGSLKKFRIALDNSNSEVFDEIVLQSVRDMLPLRNDFIEFIENVSLLPEDMNISIFVEFFERLSTFLFPSEEMNGWREIDFDNYRFIIHELLLYFVSILIKRRRFNELAEFLRTDFFYKHRSGNGLEHKKFGLFRPHLRTIDEYRKQRFKSNLISLHADEIIKRTNEKYTKKDIRNTDLLLHYLGEITYGTDWFPILYIYDSATKIELLERLKSSRFFEQVKPLFGVQTKEELQKKFELFKNPYKGYSSSWEGIADIKYHINPTEICVLA